ncbi:MAG: beta-CASP ribonuclease aCPSF1, partial [Thermoplasmatales archaeon]|nr:beta-CASP ribonuclease aCPSF1 [Thermoplasmatales archaeon]
MTVDDVLREIKGKIRGVVPVSIDISDVEFEGALLVIYTKTPDKFATNRDIVKNLAKTLQKRIVVRPDPSVLTDIDIAEKKIKSIIPKDAEITNIYFQPDVGEVTIEAMKPGAAIGKEGLILNEIRKTINWTPSIIRAPPIQSKTVK